jgi:hypothetical protein
VPCLEASRARRTAIADEVFVGDLQLGCLREHGEIVQQRHPKRPRPRIPREDVRDRSNGLGSPRSIATILMNGAVPE